MEDSKIRCPYCREFILEGAIKCKHCGSMLTDAPPSSGAIGGITLVRQALSGRYEIQEEIGRGGMATVYRAVQKNLNRPVALKVIHQNLVHDSEFVARFHREAQVCASLQHPNIVTVYDEGEISGVHFMAMELLDGHDLHRIIRQHGNLQIEQTLIWLAPIAEALQYAHSRGIIHRDIKSSNILVTQSGRTVLMDFGIAHAASGTRLTQTGLVIGTPEYMSPEQAEGRSIDQRIDIYSLGIVLYECLTGKVPFKADNPLSIIMKVVNEAPDPPIHLNNQIPDWLNQVVLICMAKNPADRYSDAGQLLQVLSSPQLMQPVSPAAKPKQPVSKNPVPEKAASPQSHVPYKKNKSTLKPIIWLLVVLLMLLGGIYGYQVYDNASSAYRQAAHENTIQSYEQYLNQFGWTDFDGKIKDRLYRLHEQERQLAAEHEKERQEAERQAAETRRIAEEQRRNDPFHDQMVFVQGGSFRMGCTSEQGSDCLDDEKPAHQVFLDDYYIGTHEVTQKQWLAVIGNKPKDSNNCDDCPVNISWDEIQVFIKILNQKTNKNYRLPTEAEWEYSARGGAFSKRYKYSGSNNINDVAWYKTFLHPVGLKKPNELGLYDMSGNVWEWCSDRYSVYTGYDMLSPEGSSNGSFRVKRGGSYMDNDITCRVSRRNKYLPTDNGYNNIGFRLAHSR